MRTLILGSVVLLAACGGNSPTEPPPAPPAATLATVTADLQLPNWPCPDGSCRYKFAFRNNGPDCARNVRGTFRLTRADNVTVLATDDWAIDATRTVRAAEQVDVEDGPIALSVIQGLGTEVGKYTVSYQFEAVRCQ